MRNLKLKIAKMTFDLERITAKDLVNYSKVINQIQIKNSIRFVWNINPVT